MKVSKKLLLIALLAVILLGGVITTYKYYKSSPGTTTEAISADKVLITNKSSSGSVTITAEVADTASERAQGLMNRTHLGEEEGMLFVFENENVVSFWMKDTLISLDMIFLDRDLKIVHIEQNTKVNQTSETYSSQKPVKFVLEVNGGLSEENNYTIGDTLRVKNLLK